MMTEDFSEKPCNGKSIFVQLPFSCDGRRKLICITLNPSVWKPTAEGLKSLVLPNSDHHCQVASSELLFVVNNGRVLRDDCPLQPDQEYSLQCRVLGGKGGFGSLLRSFGSQISKNRNQDACRDLSGRRLRNVKAEKRVKEYVEKQAEKDKEKKKKKEEKILKLKTALESKPKHNFHDPEYEAERKRIPEKVFSAVEEGIRVISSEKAVSSQSLIVAASTSRNVESSDGSGEETSQKITLLPIAAEKKRKHEDPLVKNMKSKRMKGWLGVEDDSDDSEEDAN